MLIKIAVKNFIIIEQLDIDFEHGLNVLTGETGAGKSIILGAVRLSLGERSSGNPVRVGCDKAIVQTVFSVENHPILADSYEDNQLIFTREITKAGRSIQKINGEVVTLTEARTLASQLLTIHGQNDFQSILEPKGQLLLIDAFLTKEGRLLKRQVDIIASELEIINQKQKELNLSPEGVEREIERVKFQMNDIDSANLSDEDERVESTYLKMTKAKTYIDLAQTSAHILDNDDMESASITTMLSHLINATEKLSEIDPELTKTIEQLNEMSFNLSEITDQFNRLINDLMFEPQELIDTEKRLDLVNQIKKKYGNTLSAIGDYRLSLDAELEQLSKQSTLKADLDTAYQKTLNKYYQMASQLTEQRLKASNNFESAIVKTLLDLKFDDVLLEVKFAKQPVPKRSGADKVDIEISLNKGMTLKPIKQAASGGEISRIMLVIKEIMADKDNVSTLIFDEIDAGISGETASIVAEKLKCVSKHHQVILISHLAQVALVADKHFKIEKNASDQQSISNIIALDDEARAHEIARIMGGLNIDDNLLYQARQLVNKSKTDRSIK